MSRFGEKHATGRRQGIYAHRGSNSESEPSGTNLAVASGVHCDLSAGKKPGRFLTRNCAVTIFDSDQNPGRLSQKRFS